MILLSIQMIVSPLCRVGPIPPPQGGSASRGVGILIGISSPLAALFASEARWLGVHSAPLGQVPSGTPV